MLLGVGDQHKGGELASVLASAAKPLRAGGLDVAMTVRDGDPAEEIVRVAQDSCG
jgi:hypothetical protein